MPDAPTIPSTIVLFDGECNLCNASVRFMIDHDPRGQLHFASQQSVAGQKLMADHGEPGGGKSIVVIDGDRIYTRSAAPLRLARYLTFPWRLGQWLVVVPRPVLDALYDLIARHRYRLFGRRDACQAPSPELRERFLD